MADNTILAKMAVVIGASTLGFKDALNKSQNDLSNFVSNVQKIAGTLGLGFGINTLVKGFFNAIDSIKELEHQLKTVQAITGATTKEFEALRESALKLGSTTQFNAKEVAELQTEFGRLGFTTSEILAASKATAQLATATGEDLAKSADTVGSVIRSFGLDASETSRVVDVMAESFNRSALGLDNFTEAMKYVAPIAKSADISLEETTALLGTLADSGIRGSMAGTSLRKIITDLAKDGRPLQERLKELAAKGLSFSEANEEVGRTAYASLLILTANERKTQDLTKALFDVKGAAKETADIVGNDLSGDLKQLSGSYDGLIQSASGANSILRDIVQTSTSVLRAFSSQDGAIGKLVSDFLKIQFAAPKAFLTGIKETSNVFSGNINLTKEQVEETAKTLKKLIDESKLKGNQEDVITYTKLLAGLASQYGLIKDKAVEFKEVNPFDNDGLKNSIVTLDVLKQRLKDLKDTFSGKISVLDTIALDKSRQAIKKLEDQIKQIENPDTSSGIELIRKKLQELNTEYDKTSFKNEQRRRDIALEIDALEALLKSYERLRDFDPSKIDLGDKLNFFSDESFLSDKFLKQINDRFDKFKFVLKKKAKEIKDNVLDFTGPIQSGISGIAEAIGKATVDSTDFGKNILKAVASFAKQLGELLVGIGVGMLALKKVINNPYAAIVAGAALIALAGAAEAAAQKAQDSFNNGSAQTSSVRNSVNANTQNINGQPIKLFSEVKVKGQDIYIALNNYLDNNKGTKFNG